jgi:glyceraldehyde-3-phosphate dehydrogenase (NADP+)
VQRVLVHRSIYHSTLTAIARRTESLVVGRKRSPETDVGPMITVGEAERVPVRSSEWPRNSAWWHP